MPVPSSISDLSTTPALNSPPGSESPSLVDDYLRTLSAFLKQVSDASVQTSGNQTVAGTKTFSASPVVPDATAAKHPVTKDQHDTKAPLASPAFTGTPTVPTANPGTSTTQAASTAFVAAATPPASTSVVGQVELATVAETQAGTDAARAVTPASLSASVMGMAQQWTDQPSRVLGTNYTNTTGRAICVSVTFFALTSTWACSLNVSGLRASHFEQGNASGQYVTLHAVVPAGAVYNASGTGASINTWREMR